MVMNQCRGHDGPLFLLALRLLFLSSSSSQHWSYRPTVAPSPTRDPGLQAHRGDASTEAAVSIEAGFHELLHSHGNSEVGAANSAQGS